MLLSTAVEQVAMECDLEKSTVDQYKRAVRRFSAWLGNPATSDDLAVSKLNGFIHEIQQRTSGTTARNYRVSITRIWNYLVETEDLPSYDVRRLRRPKLSPRPVSAWSTAQFATLLKAASSMPGRLRCGVPVNDFLTAWLWIAFDTGIRPSDIRLLTWASVDFNASLITIVQHKTGNSHSGMLSPECLAAINKINLGHPHVFPLTKGGVRRLELNLYREAAKLGFSRLPGQGLGTLRKTHATEIYNSDGLNAAAESLGHVGGTRTARASYVDQRAVKQGRLPRRPDAA